MTYAQHADSSNGSAFLQFDGESDEEPDSRSFTSQISPSQQRAVSKRSCPIAKRYR